MIELKCSKCKSFFVPRIIGTQIQIICTPCIRRAALTERIAEVIPLREER